MNVPPGSGTAKHPNGSDLFSTKTSSQRDLDVISAVSSTRVDAERWHGVIPVKYGMCTPDDRNIGHTKWNQTLKLIGVALVPVVIMIVQNAIGLSNVTKKAEENSVIKNEIGLSMELANVVHRLQLERGNTALLVGSRGDPGVYTDLLKKYAATDEAIEALTTWPKLTDEPSFFLTPQTFNDHFKDFREKLDPSNTTVRDVITFYTADVTLLIHWIAKSIQYSKDNDLWHFLVGYHLLILSKEEAGIERALGSTFYAQGDVQTTLPTRNMITSVWDAGGFSAADHSWYMEKQVKGMAFLDQSKEYAPRVREYINSMYRNSTLEDTLRRMRTEIQENNISSLSVAAGNWWFDNMTQYINILKDIHDSLASDIIERLDQEVETLEENLTINIILLMISIVLTPIIIFWIYRLTSQIQRFAHNLKDKTRDLECERKRTQALLNEMLPASVAKSLVRRKSVPPESFESVTVFFSDIVGFTTISSKCGPLEVVSLLSQLYEAFDDRLELYDVYKVETIGDGYMVASGLPRRNGDRHASEIANLSLDVLETISHLVIPVIPNEKLKLRVGVNSGPVVAGIVGTKMPRYCLFGDTVNTASRMESSGEPMKVQISASTKAFLDRHGGYVIEERGLVSIKGKGMMHTYWLKGKTVGHNRREVIDIARSLSHL